MFPVSETKIAPVDGNTATPYGEEKRADEPEPSARPAMPVGLPAIVKTSPEGETVRMQLLL